MGPAVKRGNLEFRRGILDALLFVEKDFITIINDDLSISVYMDGQ